MAGRSSLNHFWKAASAAPLIAFPAIKVIREAEAEPEFPWSPESDEIIFTFSGVTPITSAAICAIIVCVPCPTSAPAWWTITFSILPSPRISTLAQEFSWYPNENPTFLKPAAKPRPWTTAESEGKDEDLTLLFFGFWSHPNLFAAASMTSETLTGPGAGVPTPRVNPSLSAFCNRNRTGSIPSFSASLFIWPSAINNACGAPKPRKAAPGILFV